MTDNLLSTMDTTGTDGTESEMFGPAETGSVTQKHLPKVVKVTEQSQNFECCSVLFKILLTWLLIYFHPRSTSFKPQVICLYMLIYCCFSVTQSCPTLCDPMNRSTPGLAVLHYLMEFTQTHVHPVSDAIQPPHPLLPASPLALNLSQHQGLLQWVGSFIRWPKYSSFTFNISPYKWIFRVDLLYDWLVWSPCRLRNPQEFSPAPQFEDINSWVLMYLYGPTLTSGHDYWKNRSFDYMHLCQQSDVSAF